MPRDEGVQRYIEERATDIQDDIKGIVNDYWRVYYDEVGRALKRGYPFNWTIGCRLKSLVCGGRIEWFSMTYQGKGKNVHYSTFNLRNQPYQHAETLKMAVPRERSVVKQIDRKAQEVERQTDMLIKLMRSHDALEAMRRR